MYEETPLLHWGRSFQSSTQAIIFLLSFITFFPVIYHIWRFQHLYGLSIFPQACPVFKPPQKMSDYKDGARREAEWPGLKSWKR